MAGQGSNSTRSPERSHVSEQRGHMYEQRGHVSEQLRQREHSADHVTDSLATDNDISIFSALSESHQADDGDRYRQQNYDVGANMFGRQAQMEQRFEPSSGQLPAGLLSAILAPGFLNHVVQPQRHDATLAAHAGYANVPVNGLENGSTAETARSQDAPQHGDQLPSAPAPPNGVFSLKPVNYGDDLNNYDVMSETQEKTQVSLTFVDKQPVVSQQQRSDAARWQASGDALSSAAGALPASSDNPRAVFDTLSAQNYEGMELIRAQIEAQRQQVEQFSSISSAHAQPGVATSSQSTSTIMLHPPVQLDTSGLSAAGATDHSQLASSSQGSSRAHTSGAEVTDRKSPVTVEQQQRVTWHDASFNSISSGR